MKIHLFVFLVFGLLIGVLAARDGKEPTNSTRSITANEVASNSTITLNNVSKAVEKLSYPKKVISLKKRPTKTPSSFVTTAPDEKAKTKKAADVTVAFKDLPADDYEFIKELDKQFKLHGDKIKIKVERENSTESSKNTKRTIEGELGYGHQHNGYEYERPKFMFYPYSQHDIMPDAPGYYPPKTSVSIEPSYSYELKPQTYVEHHDEHQQPQIDVPHGHGGPADGGEPAPQQHYEEPVIVLRIPGPTKYATHLQSLLQQYLEIRAAQYLRILENNDLPQHGGQELHVQHQQQHQYEQQQHVDLQAPALEQEHHHVQQEEHQYSPEVVYAHQMSVTPAPIMYPEIDDVYQSYKGRHQQAPLQHQQQQQHVQHEQHEQQQYLPPAAEHQGHQAEAPQLYYLPAHYAHAQGPMDHSYQNVYYIAMDAQPVYQHQQQQQHQQHQHQEQEQLVPEQPIYIPEEESAEQHHHHHHHHHQHDHHLALTENNPRKTHTKAIFTHNSEQGAADYTHMYPLPSIRPFERHSATPAPVYQNQHQHYQQHSEHFTPLESQADAGHLNYDESQHQDTVAITQRPFNYHAHPMRTSKRRVNRKRGAAASPRSVEQTDKHFDQIRDYVRDKLGAQMSSAVEFKTTQVVKT